MIGIPHLTSVAGTTDRPRRGRPRRKVSARALEAVLFGIADGESLSRCCREAGLAKATVLRRLFESKELSDQYARARDLGADVLAARVVDTATMCLSGKLSPEHARVAIDAFKWAAARMSPRRWGDAASQRVAAQAVAAEATKAGFSFRIDLGAAGAVEGSDE